MLNFPKRCTCCTREHTALEWDRLPLVGVQDDGVEQLELRNCFCGSTIAVTLSCTEFVVEDPPMRARSTFRAAETLPAPAGAA